MRNMCNTPTCVHCANGIGLGEEKGGKERENGGNWRNLECEVTSPARSLPSEPRSKLRKTTKKDERNRPGGEKRAEKSGKMRHARHPYARALRKLDTLDTLMRALKRSKQRKTEKNRASMWAILAILESIAFMRHLIERVPAGLVECPAGDGSANLVLALDHRHTAIHTQRLHQAPNLRTRGLWKMARSKDRRDLQAFR